MYLDAPHKLVPGQFNKSKSEIDKARESGNEMLTWTNNYSWDDPKYGEG